MRTTRMKFPRSFLYLTLKMGATFAILWSLGTTSDLHDLSELMGIDKKLASSVQLCAAQLPPGGWVSQEHQKKPSTSVIRSSLPPFSSWPSSAGWKHLMTSAELQTSVSQTELREIL